MPGRVSAAWQGTAVPDGVTFRNCRAQPPMQDFGRCAMIVGHDIVDGEHALQRSRAASTMRVASSSCWRVGSSAARLVNAQA